MWSFLRIARGEIGRCVCLLGEFVGGFCWESLLGEFVGRFCWESLLGGFVGRVCWEGLLGEFVGRVCLDRGCWESLFGDFVVRFCWGSLFGEFVWEVCFGEFVWESLLGKFVGRVCLESLLGEFVGGLLGWLFGEFVAYLGLCVETVRRLVPSARLFRRGVPSRWPRPVQWAFAEGVFARGAHCRLAPPAPVMAPSLAGPPPWLPAPGTGLPATVRPTLCPSRDEYRSSWIACSGRS